MKKIRHIPENPRKNIAIFAEELGMKSRKETHSFPADSIQKQSDLKKFDPLEENTSNFNQEDRNVAFTKSDIEYKFQSYD